MELPPPPPANPWTPFGYLPDAGAVIDVLLADGRVLASVGAWVAGAVPLPGWEAWRLA